MLTVAVISPGAMGSALGRGYREAGARVVTTVAGRSARTQQLAQGMEVLSSLEEVVAISDIVVSIVPPGTALQVAGAVARAAARTGSRPLYADLNAVSPQTMRRMSQQLDGLELVDGSISGAPPEREGTRLYLSGSRATTIADLSHPRLHVHVLDGPVGAASAVKMSTSSVYKGISAVLLQALEVADTEGVLDLVLADLAIEYPELTDNLPARLASSVSKAHRYVAEMHEISTTQVEAGLGPELFQAVAGVWSRASKTPLARMTPETAKEQVDVRAVLDLL